MPKTPLQSETTNRFNPYISKSISKTLLTPCRQVGLSRNRKTPNSTNKKTPTSIDQRSSDDPNLDNISVVSSSLDTTPVSSKVTLAVPIAHENKVLNKSQSEVINKKKTRVSKCLISASNEEDNVCLPLETTKLDIKELNSASKVTVEQKIKSQDVCNEAEGEILQKKQNGEGPICTSSKVNDFKGTVKKSKKSMRSLESDTKDNKIKRKRGETGDNNYCQVDFVENKASVVKQGKIKDNKTEKNRLKERNQTPNNDEVEFLENKIVEVKQDKTKESKLKKIMLKEIGETPNNSSQTEKKAIEIKQKVSTSGDVTHIDLTLPESLIKEKSLEVTSKSSYLKESPLDLISNKPVVGDKKNRKIKRSLSMKKSNSDEYKENKQGSPVIDKEVNTTCEVDLHMLKELEKQVHKKRELVDSLRQAEIYKKKCDVKELQELTALWKSGCTAALNELLPLLQEHGQIDMATLLNNLRIPEEIITLSEDGNLI
jgi:hypothetical protein